MLASISVIRFCLTHRKCVTDFFLASLVFAIQFYRERTQTSLAAQLSGLILQVFFYCRSMVHRLWIVAGQEGQHHGVVLPLLLYVVGRRSAAQIFALGPEKGKKRREGKRSPREKGKKSVMHWN